MQNLIPHRTSNMLWGVRDGSMKPVNHGQAGLAIVEVAIAGALLGVISLALMDVMANTSKMGSRADVRERIRFINENIRSNLSNPVAFQRTATANNLYCPNDTNPPNPLYFCNIPDNAARQLSYVRDRNGGNVVGNPSGGRDNSAPTIGLGLDGQSCSGYRAPPAAGNSDCPLRLELFVSTTGGLNSTTTIRGVWREFNPADRSQRLGTPINTSNYDFIVTMVGTPVTFDDMCRSLGGTSTVGPPSTCNINPMIGMQSCQSMGGVWTAADPSSGSCDISGRIVAESCAALGGSVFGGGRPGSICIIHPRDANTGLLACQPGDFVVRVDLGAGLTKIVCEHRYATTQTSDLGDNYGNGTARCADGGAVIGFTNNQPICGPAIKRYEDNPAAASCAPGQYAVAYKRDGTPRCFPVEQQCGAGEVLSSFSTNGASGSRTCVPLPSSGVIHTCRQLVNSSPGNAASPPAFSVYNVWCANDEIIMSGGAMCGTGGGGQLNQSRPDALGSTQGWAGACATQDQITVWGICCKKT